MPPSTSSSRPPESPEPLSTDADDPLSASLAGDELPDLTESMRLVQAAQGGDREALDDLLRRYTDRITRIVRIRLSAKLRRVVESVDIVQETYRLAFQNIEKLELRSTASILQWLARIAENHMIDVHRFYYGQKRDKQREVNIEGPRDLSGIHLGDAAPPTDDLGPAELAERAEIKQLVDEAVAQLPDDDREVILLRSYHGGTWEFCAQALGRPTAEATRQLHRRARIRLAKLLRDKLGPEDD